MTLGNRNETRAGAVTPPASFSGHSPVVRRLSAGRARRCLGVLLSAAALLGVASCSHAPRPREVAPPPAPQAGTARLDALNRAIATADSSARVAEVAGRADSLAAVMRADSLAQAFTAEAARADSMARGRPLVDSPAPVARDTARGPFDYMWVVRTSLLSPQSVDAVVASAREQHVKGLLVQVIGRGDAYYRSERLPRSEALPRDDFDPLGRLVDGAHAAGIEVHAWINCMLVWSAEQRPRDPHHVVNEHPEWIARMKDGRRLSQLTPRQRRNLGLEGIFLAPAHPGVRQWLAGNAQEIVRRYPVDGVHLDYIRQPAVAIGWDPTTRARFAMETGVDPGRFDRVPATQRAHVDSLWKQFQSEQVRQTVEEVRDSVRAIRPGLPMSAAVIADTVTAEKFNMQTWRDWLTRGTLDRVFVMCYAPAIQTVMEQLVGYSLGRVSEDRIVPGIAVYNTPPAAAAAKIKGARALGFPMLALYSYDSLAEQPGYWSRLLRLLDVSR